MCLIIPRTLLQFQSPKYIYIHRYNQKIKLTRGTLSSYQNNTLLRSTIRVKKALHGRGVLLYYSRVIRKDRRRYNTWARYRQAGEFDVPLVGARAHTCCLGGFYKARLLYAVYHTLRWWLCPSINRSIECEMAFPHSTIDTRGLN